MNQPDPRYRRDTSRRSSNNINKSKIPSMQKRRETPGRSRSRPNSVGSRTMIDPSSRRGNNSPSVRLGKKTSTSNETSKVNPKKKYMKERASSIPRRGGGTPVRSLSKSRIAATSNRGNSPPSTRGINEHLTQRSRSKARKISALRTQRRETSNNTAANKLITESLNFNKKTNDMQYQPSVMAQDLPESNDYYLEQRESNTDLRKVIDSSLEQRDNDIVLNKLDGNLYTSTKNIDETTTDEFLSLSNKLDKETSDSMKKDNILGTEMTEKYENRKKKIDSFLDGLDGTLAALDTFKLDKIEQHGSERNTDSNTPNPESTTKMQYNDSLSERLDSSIAMHKSDTKAEQELMESNSNPVLEHDFNEDNSLLYSPNKEIKVDNSPESLDDLLLTEDNSLLNSDEINVNGTNTSDHFKVSEVNEKTTYIKNISSSTKATQELFEDKSTPVVELDLNQNNSVPYSPKTEVKVYESPEHLDDDSLFSSPNTKEPFEDNSPLALPETNAKEKKPSEHFEVTPAKEQTAKEKRLSTKSVSPLKLGQSTSTLSSKKKSTKRKRKKINENYTTTMVVDDMRIQVLKDVTTWGDTLCYEEERFKEDKEIVLAAVINNGSVLRYAIEELKEDKDIVLAAVTNCAAAVEHASKKLQQDEEIILAVQSAGKELGDRESALAAVSNNCWTLQYASEELKMDKDLVMAATIQNGWALQYAAKEIKDDKDSVLPIVSQSGTALYFVSDQLKMDKDVVTAAVKENGWALQFASEEMRQDRDVVEAALNQNGWAFQFAAEDLRRDKDLAKVAVSQNGVSIHFALEEASCDEDIILTAVLQNWRALRYAGEEQKRDKEIMMSIVTKRGKALKYASEEVRDDKEIVLAALAQNGNALEFASERLRSDKDIVIAAVLRTSEALIFAHSDLQRDPDCLKVATML